jgi:autotransporter-associated beta strand protein
VQTGIATALPTSKNVSIGDSGTLQISVASQTIGDLTGSGALIIDASRILTLGTATSTITFSGAISGGGTLTKVGSGTVILLGTNSYTGGTLVSAGTLQGNSNSLQGTINNASDLVFDQTFTGSFTGTITNPAGDLTVEGGALLTFSTGSSVIQSTVTVDSGGELSVNGAVTAANGFTVNAGGFLQGTGTITASTSVAGSISPGNSIGTLNIIGDYTQESGSSITIELNPTTADLLTVSGTLHIEPEATIFIVPDFGTYNSLQSYIVMQAGILPFGDRFDTVSISLPSFDAHVVYNTPPAPDGVLLLLNVIPLVDLPLSKDALIVAHCLDGATVTAFSDLEYVIDQLHFMSIQQMNTTLTQMLPSIFNALDLVQETSLIQVRETLSRQMNLYSKKQCGSLRKIRLWNDFFSTSSSQKNLGHNVGYRAHVTGDVVGLDVQVTESAYVGAGLGYAYDPISWREQRGSGHIMDDFAALYAGGWINRYLYAQGAFIGSTNVYHTKRHIVFQGEQFTPSVQVAKGRTDGHSFLSHFEFGAVVEKPVRVRPFVKTDYMFMGRDGFTEGGAESVDLVVKDHNADLLRLEGGIEFLYCIPDGFLKHATPYFSVGDVYELRFIGRTEQASLVDLHCPMTIDGLFPEQNLWFLEAGLMGQLFKDRVALGANYRQERGEHYTDHTWSLQLRSNF